MSDNVYHKVVPISRKDAEVAFSSGNSDRIGDALISIAFYDPDWRWVQDKCLYFIDSSLPDVRRLSKICLGHLARIHGKLEMNKVLPILERLRNNAEVSGTVEDTFEDIEIFIGNQRP